MSLLDIGADLLPLVYTYFIADKRGATKIWRLVCTAMRDVPGAKEHPSWLRAMGVSSALVQYYCECPVKRVAINKCWCYNFKHEILLAVCKGGVPAVIFLIAQWDLFKMAPGLNGSIGAMEKLTYTAAKAGDLDMLKMLMSMGLVATRHTYFGAARSGQLHVFEWLFHLRKLRVKLQVSKVDDLHPSCMHTYHLPTLERDCNIHLYSQVHPPSELKELRHPAILGGNPDIVWQLCTVADGKESYDMEEWYAYILEIAATHDKVEIYKRFHEAIPEYSYILEELSVHADLAGEHGSLKILQYQLDHTPVLFEEGFNGWAENLEVLKWCVDKGKMKINAYTLETVMKSMGDTAKCIECMEFLLSFNCPKKHTESDNRYADLYDAAVEWGGLDALKRIEWLYAHDFPLVDPHSEAMGRALRDNQLVLVQRLHEMGWTLTREVLERFSTYTWWMNNDAQNWARMITNPDPRAEDEEDWLGCPVVQPM
ncbi:MAG: hypothetical protein CMB11_08330 [Euryarchaeota archaeon]|nr:hypothetical protein [Euryarchaeota archaeon]